MESNSIKQPAPNVVNISDAQETKSSPTSKKEFHYPKVGAVQVPKISTTPLSDSFEKMKTEFPKVNIKPLPKDNKEFHFQNILNLGVMGAGVISLLALIFKRK